MSERTLRGTRLGATSYETDNGIELAPRQDVRYACPNGHAFAMPFAMEAEVPVGWECRVCGAQALRVDVAPPQEKPGKPTRTHWDMLLERRSMADLEEVLAERLEVLRGGGIAYASAFNTAPRGPVPGQPMPVPGKMPPVRSAAAVARAKKTAAAKSALGNKPADRPAGKALATSGPGAKANTPTQ